MHAVATQPDERRIALYSRPVDGLIAHQSPAEHMHAVSAHPLAYFPHFRLSSISIFLFTRSKKRTIFTFKCLQNMEGQRTLTFHFVGLREFK
jgi:hypothetical protein